MFKGNNDSFPRKIVRRVVHNMNLIFKGIWQKLKKKQVSIVIRGIDKRRTTKRENGKEIRLGAVFCNDKHAQTLKKC